MEAKSSASARLLDPDDKNEQMITARKEISIRGFIMHKKTLLFGLLSAVELVSIAYAVLNINKLLYQDYREHDVSDVEQNYDHSIYTDFFLRFLFPLCIARIVNFVNEILITKYVNDTTCDVAEQIATVYFSTSEPQPELPCTATRLLFNCFEIILHALILIQTKIIYTILELPIFAGGLALSKECKLQDVAIISGTAFGLELFFISFTHICGKIAAKRADYLEAYENAYEYVSRTITLPVHEAGTVFDAKQRLIDGIKAKVEYFGEKLKRDVDGFKFYTFIISLLSPSLLGFLAVYLSYSSNYYREQFLYLFLFSLELGYKTKEFFETFLKVMLAVKSFDEINKFLTDNDPKDNQVVQKDFDLNAAPPSIQFHKVFSRQIRIDDLSIPSSACVLIDGPSGCGKSTISRLLAKLNNPEAQGASGSDDHQITFNGVGITDVRNYRDIVKYIHTESPLLLDTLDENIAIAHPCKLDETEEQLKEQRRSAASKACLVKEWHDERFKDKRNIEQLSSGQKKRVGLARLFLTMPHTKILLLDEPLSGLDFNTIKIFLDNLAEMIEIHRPTILVVEHRNEFMTHPKIKDLFRYRITFTREHDGQQDHPITFTVPKGEPQRIGTWREQKEQKQDSPTAARAGVK